MMIHRETPPRNEPSPGSVQETEASRRREVRNMVNTTPKGKKGASQKPSSPKTKSGNVKAPQKEATKAVVEKNVSPTPETKTPVALDRFIEMGLGAMGYSRKEVIATFDDAIKEKGSVKSLKYLGEYFKSLFKYQEGLIDAEGLKGEVKSLFEKQQGFCGESKVIASLYCKKSDGAVFVGAPLRALGFSAETGVSPSEKIEKLKGEVSELKKNLGELVKALPKDSPVLETTTATFQTLIDAKEASIRLLSSNPASSDPESAFATFPALLDSFWGSEIAARLNRAAEKAPKEKAGLLKGVATILSDPYLFGLLCKEPEKGKEKSGNKDAAKAKRKAENALIVKSFVLRTAKKV